MPSFSGILADAFGVLVILLVPVLFLQKLAITASFWIAAIIVSELLLNPIVYYYLEPPHIEVIEQREHGIFKRIITSIAGAMLSSTGRIVTFLGTARGHRTLRVFLARAEGRRSSLDEPDAVAQCAVQSRDGRHSERVRRDRAVRRGRRTRQAGRPQRSQALPCDGSSIERYMSLDPSVGRTFSVADLLATNGAALREFQPKWAVLADHQAAGRPVDRRTARGRLAAFDRVHSHAATRRHPGDDLCERSAGRKRRAARAPDPELFRRSRA